jgi:methylated-DNA-[protein]-cysteine S-methyltransferase
MRTGIAIFATAIGPCGIAWSSAPAVAPTAASNNAVGARVSGVLLPEAEPEATRSQLLRRHAGDEMAPPAEIQTAVDRLARHLAGDPDDLRDIEIDLDDVPEFHRAVYTYLRGVGPGLTTTYGEIATALGVPGAAREVGQAMGRNPVPLIVPCHRVLATGGKLGGFSAPGGVGTKLRLLGIEGAAPDGQPALF